MIKIISFMLILLNPIYGRAQSECSVFEPSTREEFDEKKECLRLQAEQKEREKDEQKPDAEKNSKATFAENCDNKLEQLELKKTQITAASPVPEQQSLTALHNQTRLCQALKMMAKIPGEPLGATDQKASMDKKITCVQKAGYTLDWEACKGAISMYNFVLNAETAMNLQQKIRTEIKNKNLTSDVNAAAAKGDVQNAAIDATIATNKNLKQMNSEKAMAYGASVTALGMAFSKWPSNKEASVVQKCSTANAASKSLVSSLAPSPDCKTAYQQASERKGEMWANNQAKAALAAAMMEFIQKGIAAGMAMNQFGNVAKKMQDAKQDYGPTEEDIMIERCALNPSDPACVGRGNRISSPSTLSGNFGGLSDTGNNSFTMGDGLTDNFGEAGDPSNIGSKENVANVNSPFLEDAKKASGILDPAAAASMQPGSGSSGGGGGGGGGSGGGGGASLGDDLEGANTEPQKDPSIKANEATGNYKFAGGGGYKGLQGEKAEANPFNSMFNNKGQGGIEEDRSIASGDIDGQASGLFQKISKKYDQMQADKRIEAINLE